MGARETPPGWIMLKPFQMIGLLAFDLDQSGRIKSMHWMKYLLILTAACIVIWFLVGSGYAYTLMYHPGLTFSEIGHAYLYTTSTTDSVAIFTSITMNLVMAIALAVETFFLSRHLPDVWNFLDSYGGIDQAEAFKVSQRSIKWVSR